MTTRRELLQNSAIVAGGVAVAGLGGLTDPAAAAAGPRELPVPMLANGPLGANETVVAVLLVGETTVNFSPGIPPAGAQAIPVTGSGTTNWTDVIYTIKATDSSTSPATITYRTAFHTYSSKTPTLPATSTSADLKFTANQDDSAVANVSGTVTVAWNNEISGTGTSATSTIAIGASQDDTFGGDMEYMHANTVTDGLYKGATVVAKGLNNARLTFDASGNLTSQSGQIIESITIG